MGVMLLLMALLLYYLDPNENKHYAAAAISIVPNLVTFYVQNIHSPVGDPLANNVRAIHPKQRRYVIPAPLLFSILIVVIYAFQNFLLEIFRAGLDQLALPDDKYVEIQVFNAGELAFGSMLPLSALWAIRIGFRPSPIYWHSAFLAAAITIGSIMSVTTMNAALRGTSPIGAMLGALFLGNTEPVLPPRGKWLLVALTIGDGILVIIVMGTWLLVWAKLGQWQFHRRYSVVTS